MEVVPQPNVVLLLPSPSSLWIFLFQHRVQPNPPQWWEHEKSIKRTERTWIINAATKPTCNDNSNDSDDVWVRTIVHSLCVYEYVRCVSSVSRKWDEPKTNQGVMFFPVEMIKLIRNAWTNCCKWHFRCNHCLLHLLPIVFTCKTC